MPRRSRAALVAALALAAAVLAACGPAPTRTPDGSSTAAPPSGPAPSGAPTASGSPRPAAGHEVYGYVPYWEMDAGIAAHLRATPLTTLGLFSVTNTTKGAIDTRQPGYKRIVSPRVKGIVREASERGVRVELVFSSFGRERNDRFFGDLELQDATIASLVALVGELGLDGVNADVEGLDPALVPAYGAFVGRLRDAVVAADAADRVSVATQAAFTGAAMAAAAAAAGADRIFLMGYDYRVNGSQPGAVAPIERRDGDERDLAWSLDLYEALGVPVERTLLGLPLYGRAWPVTDPELGAPATGRGDEWIPRRNRDLLTDLAAVPLRDEVEMVELYVLDARGDAVVRASADPDGSPGPTASIGTGPWTAIYVDSPATLEPKLALANERGLAGVGFWAIGYERGLPGYTDLIARFAAGDAMERAIAP